MATARRKREASGRASDDAASVAARTGDGRGVPIGVDRSVVVADWIDRAVLAVLVALIPIRTFLGETHEFAVASWFRNLPGPPTVGPATTFVMFLVIALCAIAIAASRLAQGDRWKRTGMSLGLALFAAAGAISTWRAGQKHLALIGTLDFAGFVLLAMTLRQVITRPWQARLALAAVLGAGGAVVARSTVQVYIELPDTVAMFEKEYRAVLTSGAAAQDAGRLYDFEQRLRSGAATAYFSHANVLGGYLILIVMTGVGTAAARWRNGGKASAVIPVGIALLATANLWKTQSKGAAAALAIALALWSLGRFIVAPRIRLKATTVAIAVWAGFVAICAGVVGVLTWNPSALGLSMRFRWLYWQGAADLLRHEGLWGVGAGNFGRFFTRYKPLICPEDVQDPHSWIVRATTEWGAMGLLALIAIMIGWSWRTARARNEPRASASGPNGGRDAQVTSGVNLGNSTFTSKSHPSLASARGSYDSLHAIPSGGWGDVATDNDSRIGRSIGIWSVVIFAAVILTWTLATLGGGFIAWQTSVGVGAACFLACFILASIERRGEAAYSDTPWPCDPWALCAGLFGFILHAGVDLELFWAGPATTAFALAAIVQAMLTEPAFKPTSTAAPDRAAARRTPSPFQGEGRGEGLMEKNRRYPIVALLVMMAGLTVVAMLWKPLVKTSLVYDIFLNAARISDRTVEMDAYRLSNSNECYQKAVRICERDGTAHDEWTGELAARAATTADCDRILALIAQWRPLDPHDSAVDQREAMVLARRYSLSNDLSDLRASIKAMLRVVAAYPTSPVRRMTLGQLYEKLADDTKDAAARADAAREYQAALDCDAGRILVSKPNRFTDEQRAALAARVAALSSGR